MKPAVLGIVLTLSVLATGYIFLVPQLPSVPTKSPTLLSYSNDRYGISFSYPVGYILSEEDSNTPAVTNHTITLIAEEDAVPVIAGGEGPVSVTIEVTEDVSRTLPYTDVLETAKSSSATNFHLSDGTYDRTDINGTEAISYHWSGLYEGETTFFIHRGKYQIAVSVTYHSRTDKLRSVYDTVLATFVLR